MSEGTTVRICHETHRKLKRMAAQADEPLTTILDQAIEAYRRQRFLDDANASFAALKKNKRQWEHEQREREAWDTTLSDGLEDNG